MLIRESVPESRLYVKVHQRCICMDGWVLPRLFFGVLRRCLLPRQTSMFQAPAAHVVVHNRNPLRYHLPSTTVQYRFQQHITQPILHYYGTENKSGGS